MYLLKSLIIGAMVGLYIYSSTQKKLNIKEITLIVLTTIAIFLVIDLLAPSYDEGFDGGYEGFIANYENQCDMKEEPLEGFEGFSKVF